MPDDHSELVPPLPIPNRTVKRLSADDSAATSVKVGHRQAVTPENPRRSTAPGVFAFGGATGEVHGAACACRVSVQARHLAQRNVGMLLEVGEEQVPTCLSGDLGWRDDGFDGGNGRGARQVPRQKFLDPVHRMLGNL